MSPLMQNFLFAYTLPNVLLPLVIALVAILGVARWRRTLLTLALVELIALVLGILMMRIMTFGAARFLPIPIIEFLQGVGFPLINIALSITWVGALIALVLAARGRTWGWFIVLLVAAIISALAIEFAFSSYGLLALYGPQAVQLFAEPTYVIITNGLAGLTILTQLLYALFRARTPADSAPPASMSDEVTLP